MTESKILEEAKQIIKEWLDKDTEPEEDILYLCRIAELFESKGDLPSVTPTQRWIPVSERLPKDGTWNIFTDGKKISIERYKLDAIDHFYPSGRFFSLEEAIAWQPLPERYEEKRGDNKPKTYIDCQKCENFRNPDYSKCMECEKRGSENDIYNKS